MYVILNAKGYFYEDFLVYSCINIVFIVFMDSIYALI